MNKITLIITLLFVSIIANAYTPRNLLQNRTSLTELQEVLIMNQHWVPYPAYHNREAWNELLGERKNSLLNKAKRNSIMNGK